LHFLSAALRCKRKIRAVGLPSAFVSKLFWAISKLELGVIISIAVVLLH
jgi:hypothetical protein